MVVMLTSFGTQTLSSLSLIPLSDKLTFLHGTELSVGAEVKPHLRGKVVIM